MYSDEIEVNYTGKYGGSKSLDIPMINMKYQFDEDEDVVINFKEVPLAETYEIEIAEMNWENTIWSKTIDSSEVIGSYSFTLPADLFSYDTEWYGYQVAVVASASGMKSSASFVRFKHEEVSGYDINPRGRDDIIIGQRSAQVRMYTSGADEVIMYSKEGNGAWNATHIQGDINMLFNIDTNVAHTESYYFKARYGSEWIESGGSSVRVYNPYEGNRSKPNPDLLDTLTIPASTKEIDDEAFEGVSAESIILPNGLLTIGSRAFANCSNLTYIAIPDSVESISNDAFEGCGDVYIKCFWTSVAAQFAIKNGFEFGD